jgi:CPA1 family monovalent cation:H+ antiporter
MLVAVLLSNIITRFVPALSAPLVQIALGVVIWLIPYGAFGMEFKLDPKLIFVLFVAPLVYHVGYISDKKTLWTMKGPILGTAIFLVFINVIAGGYLVHFLIPAIPLAAAFALLGALSPTGDGISKRVAVPPKITGILCGESVISEAIGIICFQFAIAAMAMGFFSLPQATLQFTLFCIGGLFIGIILILLKYVVVKRFFLLGMSNVTLHILMGILTPFVVYMIADALAVSGILAVFAAGITHSSMRDKFNPEAVKLNTAGDNIWEFLSFTLDALVFVMLGTQLPGILKAINNDTLFISGFEIAGYILLITMLFIALRFFWWLIIVRKKTYQEPKSPIHPARAAIIFSLSGVRGAVALAIILSIPYTLDDGMPFPERSLMVLIASGVIVCTMLVSNFILPLFASRVSEEEQNNNWQALVSEIVSKVITRLKNEATDENRRATMIIVKNYFNQQITMFDREALYRETQIEKKLRAQIFLWEKEYTAELLESGKTDKAAAAHFLDKLSEHSKTVETKGLSGFFRQIGWFLRRIIEPHHKIEMPTHDNYRGVLALNTQHVIEKLREIKTKENKGVVEKLIVEFELIAAEKHGKNFAGSDSRSGIEDSVFHAVIARGFSIEREIIQEMFEENRLSRDDIKKMRTVLDMLEIQVHSDFA